MFHPGLGILWTRLFCPKQDLLGAALPRHKAHGYLPAKAAVGMVTFPRGLSCDPAKASCKGYPS